MELTVTYYVRMVFGVYREGYFFASAGRLSARLFSKMISTWCARDICPAKTPSGAGVVCPGFCTDFQNACTPGALVQVDILRIWGRLGVRASNPIL